VVSKGDGKDVKAGDLVSVQYRIVNAADSALLDSSARGVDDQLPVLLDPNQQSLFVAALECQPLGSSVVLALPGKLMGEGQKAIVVTRSPRRLCRPSRRVRPSPRSRDADGEARQGRRARDHHPEDRPAHRDDHREPQAGRWPDGAERRLRDRAVPRRDVGRRQEFDSSWKRKASAQFQTTGVVPGFQKALEGQKVGSQVLVVIPPADGYRPGAERIGELDTGVRDRHPRHGARDPRGDRPVRVGRCARALPR
jgi:peptidylprolyl isomerase